MEYPRYEQNSSVADFVSVYAQEHGDAPAFLVGASSRTKRLNECFRALLAQEAKVGGVLLVDITRFGDITSHPPGYISKSDERIVGLQGDKPLMRIMKPYGGVHVVRRACMERGASIPLILDAVLNTLPTQNQGIYDTYTPLIRTLRKLHIITGLPDAYGRGRLIGEYTRVARFGTDELIARKCNDLSTLEACDSEEVMRLREEVSKQIRALVALTDMAHTYGYDISKPARGAHEAVQWTYFAYLGAVKQQDGAAMSLGPLDAFFDVYIEEDLRNGVLTEEEAQELIDQFVLKLRAVRHLRPRAYDDIFAGDPVWATLTLGGMWNKTRTKVNKTTYRFLQTLYNLGPAPEPNITVLWSPHLPEEFKRFCAQVSIDTSAIQYENDLLMQEDMYREHGGSIHSPHACNIGISCCVSRMQVGEEMQYFGARMNGASMLRIAINAGRADNGSVVVPDISPLPDSVLNYDEVWSRLEKVVAFLAQQYVQALNIIHYQHDKHNYESLQMALHDTHVRRMMAFGLAGLSVVADSLSAIKYAEVEAVRNAEGLAIDFTVRGEYPCYGNDIDAVDDIANKFLEYFMSCLRSHWIYRQAVPTLSILTITSNVMYGRHTGATPDGRKAGEPFAPGANPMHNREQSGALAALHSVSKLPYRHAQDGISNTVSFVPHALGAEPDERTENLHRVLDWYFGHNGHHLNVNVIRREVLEDAMRHPEQYGDLVIRVSGYAVRFVKLSPEQQKEVVARTFHEELS